MAEWLIDRGALSSVPVYAGIGLTVSAVGSWLVHERLMYPVDTVADALPGMLPAERAGSATTTEELA